MKKQLFRIIALALLTIVACKQPVVVEKPESPDYAEFDRKVEVVRSFIKAHSNENLDALTEIISDTVQWSPAAYNANKMLGKANFLAALKNYHDNFDNIKFTEGITLGDSLVNGMWSGSVFPKENATITPNSVRIYGTWTATHTESGKNIGVKFFALGFVNDDGKIVNWSDYFDVNGIATQVAEE
jgi:limonene-1,2-epoxide hydrolase